MAPEKEESYFARKQGILVLEGRCKALVIQSNNRVKLFWDIIMTIMILYSVITTLFFISFGPPSSEEIMSLDLVV